MIIIRFGYRPPNPGPNSRVYKHVKSYTDIETALENYDGHSSIWIKYNNNRFVEIDYAKLLELACNK